ncbi:MAG: hypothetical protein JXR56_09380 [Candidatus Cloacimonetes bacterium]|nr:hypothetical protein [Candidatus Cloacimonadota bacterium]
MKKIVLLIIFITTALLQSLELDFNLDSYQYSYLYNLREEYRYPDSPGVPAIPFESRIIALPYGSKVEDIAFTSNNKTFEIDFEIPPILPNATLTDGIFTTLRNEDVYNSDRFYPEKPYYVNGSFRKNGMDFISLIVYPFRYNPISGEVIQYNDAHFSISFKMNDAIAEEQSKMLLNNMMLEKVMSDISPVNPEVVSSYYNHQQSQRDGRPSLVSESEPYSCVIITNNTLLPEWSSFITHKTGLGISINAYSTTTINANYTGRDTAEKIRSFLIDAYTTWANTPTPLEYVILGGDSGQVPARLVRVDAYYSGRWWQNNIPSDNYYAALDGDWDNDADNIFGEGDATIDANASGSAGDEADYFQEIYVGRAACDTATNLQNWINKTIDYENSLIDAQYLKQSGFIGEYLGSGIYGDDYMDEISNFVPEFYQTKLYARAGTFNKPNITNLINSGVNFISHIGHGTYSEVFSYYAGDVDTLLTNTEYCFIYSQACHTAKFYGSNCIGEVFLKDENGAFAYIGNTHYGFYSTFLNQGASQFYNREFLDAIQNEGIEEIGRANADSKEDIVAMVGTTGSLRQVYMELTLLGDPTVSLHKDVATLTAEQTLSNEITLHLSDFTPDATAFTASYTIYERDAITSTISVSNISVSGNDIILTLASDIPEGYPYNIDISDMTGVSGTLIRQIDMLSNIRELSVITEEVWSPVNNPYYIYKYLLVRNSLTIEPGVELRINEDAGILVYENGLLRAEGTAENPIEFTAYDPDSTTESAWVDITFYRDLNSTQHSLSYCNIKNATTGVWVDSTVVLNIDHCTILNAPQSGIHSYYGVPSISNTIIGYDSESSATEGLYLEGCNMVIDNLTYAGNDLADISVVNSTLSIRNSILRGLNGSIVSTGSVLTIDYSNVEGGYLGIGNMDSDPLFADVTTYDYSLQSSSPCIDTGFEYISLDPDNTLPDMGALYYHHPIAFEAQFTQGDAPLSIQFANLSGGSPDQIRWDFDNDGNWDDFGDIGTFDATMSGSFDVLLRIDKGSWYDTLLKEAYIVITTNSTISVSDPAITVDGTVVTLNWIAATDADYYLIYYNIQPDAPFLFLGYSETNQFITDILPDKAFFLIKKVTLSD